MATSLTNNVLTFNNGSIKDVRNDLGVLFPISLSSSRTFSYSSSSPSTATISGSIGQTVITVVSASGGGTCKITSNGGTWIYVAGGNVGTNPGSVTIGLPTYPWGVTGMNTINLGTISLSSSTGSSQKTFKGIIAVRIY